MDQFELPLEKQWAIAQFKIYAANLDHEGCQKLLVELYTNFLAYQETARELLKAQLIGEIPTKES